MSATPHADPGLGVFETMLVVEGRPVELDSHLERLAGSLRALYDAELPAGARGAVLARGSGVRHGKLRLTVAPAGGRLRTRIATTEVEAGKVFPAPERGVALRSFVVEGGLGDHKWADRRLLERAGAAAPRGTLPLLVDTDGAVLEAARGSVFLAGEGRLATPPTDGRILPSIARRQAIEVARAQEVDTRERRLTLSDLYHGEVFLAGSVRGVEPVRSLDGLELPRPGELSGRIAAGLRRRWLRVPQGEPVAVGAGERPTGPPAR
ncbi:MAG TPA: aminotransferase class IV [Solirubrobacterales bacterium]|jgi:para-aminobenzoate synthetase/4-amino-4-deoxychorismate lyase|nr:aminotransferase class IV [Solirubrobacterales bacterium]